MPQYKVIARGFFNGRLYDPDGKRQFLTTDKPFKKNEMPSWLQDMPKETAVVRKKREAQEASREAADAEKAEQDKKDIADASFMGEGESSSGSSVETL